MELNNPNNLLIHSVQVYWNNIAQAIENVKQIMLNDNIINYTFVISLNNTINTAKNCYNTYGVFIRNPNYLNEYKNQEIMFYFQLAEIIKNEDFLINLHNYVYLDIQNGMRYFLDFLNCINIQE